MKKAKAKQKRKPRNCRQTLRRGYYEATDYGVQKTLALRGIEKISARIKSY